MKHIVSIATDWGPQNGGINAFNFDFCRALSGIAKVTCVVISENAEKRSSNSAVRVLSLKSSTSASEAIKALFEKDALPIDCVIGHDIITGAFASELAELGEVKLSLFHHMTYGFYHPIKSVEGESSDEKVAQQRALFDGREHVFGIGPKLARSAASMVGTDAVGMIVPGLPVQEPRKQPNQNLNLVFFGRLDPTDAPLKQPQLAARAFGRAVQKMEDRIRAQRFMDYELTLVGLNADDSATAAELRGLAIQEAERAVAIRAIPYDVDRERLMQRLSHATASLMLSVHEGFGLVGWETIGLGVPLIVSKDTGLYEFLAAEGLHQYVLPVDVKGGTDTGQFVANPGDIEATSEAIVGVCSNSAAFKSDAMELREKLIAREYTWQSAAAKWMKEVGLVDQASTAHHTETLWMGANPLSETRRKRLDVSSKQQEQLAGMLSDATTVAIHGMGGVGKTTFVKEFLNTHSESFEAILWIDYYATETDPVSIDPVLHFCILNGICSPLCADLQAAVDALVEFIECREGRTVVVLDGVNVQLDRLAWLERIPTCCVITTRDRYLAEQYLPLECECWRLEHSAEYLESQLKSRVSEKGCLHSLAERLEGLPIALNHAVHFLEQRKTVSVRAYTDHLEYWLARLPGHLENERTVFATVMVSVDQLAQTQPFALDMLIVLCTFQHGQIPSLIFEEPNTFVDSEIEKPEWEDKYRSDDLLGVLHNYHMVDYSPKSRALAVHDTVALCIRTSFPEKLARATEIAIKLVTGVYPRDDDSPAKSHTLNRCEALNSHCLHLLRQINDNTLRKADCLSLLNQMAVFFLTYHKNDQAEILVEMLLSSTMPVSPDSELQHTRALNMSAELARRTHDHRSALRSQIRIIRAARSSDNEGLQNGLPFYYGNLAHTLSDIDKPRWSVAFEQEGLRLLRMRRVQDWTEIGRSYSNLANHYIDYKNFDAARIALESAEGTFKKTNRPDLTVRIATLLAKIRMNLKTNAKTQLKESLDALAAELKQIDAEEYTELIERVESRASQILGTTWSHKSCEEY